MLLMDGKGSGGAGGSGSSGGGYFERITVEHYTDWYKKYPDGTMEFTQSVLNYVTYEYVYISNDSSSNGTNSSSNNDYSNHTLDYIYIPKPTNEDKIITDSLTGKAKCVFDKMVDSNNNINWILDNFNDGNKPSEFNLTFVMATDLPNYINGQTSNLENNAITVKINANTLSGRTNLEIARTILHEGIHARLKEFMYRDGNSTDSFPGIYDFYRFGKNWSHQQMVSYYRSTIAKGLKQFDNGQHLDSYYDALAWVGLNENLTDHNNLGETYNTVAWDSILPSEQATILNIIKDEKNNGNKNCN